MRCIYRIQLIPLFFLLLGFLGSFCAQGQEKPNPSQDQLFEWAQKYRLKKQYGKSISFLFRALDQPETTPKNRALVLNKIVTNFRIWDTDRQDKQKAREKLWSCTKCLGMVFRICDRCTGTGKETVKTRARIIADRGFQPGTTKQITCRTCKGKGQIFCSPCRGTTFDLSTMTGSDRSSWRKFSETLQNRKNLLKEEDGAAVLNQLLRLSHSLRPLPGMEAKLSEYGKFHQTLDDQDPTRYPHESLLLPFDEMWKKTDDPGQRMGFLVHLALLWSQYRHMLQSLIPSVNSPTSRETETTYTSSEVATLLRDPGVHWVRVRGTLSEVTDWDPFSFAREIHFEENIPFRSVVYRPEGLERLSQSRSLLPDKFMRRMKPLSGYPSAALAEILSTKIKERLIQAEGRLIYHPQAGSVVLFEIWKITVLDRRKATSKTEKPQTPPAKPIKKKPETLPPPPRIPLKIDPAFDVEELVRRGRQAYDQALSHLEDKSPEVRIQAIKELQKAEDYFQAALKRDSNNIFIQDMYEDTRDRLRSLRK